MYWWANFIAPLRAYLCSGLRDRGIEWGKLESGREEWLGRMVLKTKRSAENIIRDTGIGYSEDQFAVLLTPTIIRERVCGERGSRKGYEIFNVQ